MLVTLVLFGLILFFAAGYVIYRMDSRTLTTIEGKKLDRGWYEREMMMRHLFGTTLDGDRVTNDQADEAAEYAQKNPLPPKPF